MKNGAKNIQTAGYNGKCTVNNFNCISPKLLITTFQNIFEPRQCFFCYFELGTLQVEES